MDQSDFLQGLSQSQFSELCAALYERELLHLSWAGPDNSDFLKRRLGSLPHYVKSAAHALLQTTSPLQLDLQNASWQATAKAKPPSHKKDSDKLNVWLARHARLGLVMPVEVEEGRDVSVALDTIDELNDNALHLNRYGWFDRFGQAQEQHHATLLQPSRDSMTAACCGHQWHAGRRKAPRTLSLREVLLTLTLDWPRFTQVRPLPK